MKNKKTLFMGVLMYVLIHTLGYAQQKKVTGIVSDSSNLPMIGVNIVIKGTNTGTASDFDGRFSIDVSAGQTLVFSYIGYEVKEQVIGAANEYKIKMKPSNTALDEVVLVGYGTQKRIMTTGALSSIKTDNFVERPISRVDQGLVGQISGVRVKQTTGMPGEPFSINIRGTGSISAGNEPLYVIDGFPIHTEGTSSSGSFSNGSPLDNMNPNDIASIEILKDAAAAAIYGSRASNGVVLITTKRGKTGKPKFTFNTYSGISKEVKRVDVLTAEEWIGRAKTVIDQQWRTSGIPGALDTQTIDERRAIYNQNQTANGKPILAPDEFNTSYMYDPRWDMPGHPGLDYVDWQDRIFRLGEFNNYQISASGATDMINYYVSGNYQKNKGYVIGTDYQLFSARANIDVKLSDRFKVGVNIAPSYSIKNNPGVEGKDNTLHKALSATPVFESTTNASGDKYTTRYAWGSSTTDMLSRLSRKGENSMFRNIMSAYLSYDVIKGLTAKSTLNFDNSDNTTENYSPSSNLNSIRGSYNTYRRQNFVNENTLNYSFNIAEDHHFTALAGMSFNSYKITKASLSSGNLYNSYTIETLPSGSLGSTNSAKNTQVSYFGRLQYDYQEKYLFSASMRRDGSSKFGSQQRWGSFPSLSLGWRVTQEDFMKSVDWLSELKIRASYGVNGSNNIGNYAAFSTLGTYNYALGNGTGQGQGVSGIPNPYLHWEESKSKDFGLDFGLFNNRITGIFDYYTKLNSDLLLQVPALAASGFTSYLSNIGEVENKGWEFELTTRNVISKDFEWKTSANISHNENKVLALGPDQDKIEISSSYGGGVPFIKLEVGKPMYTIFTVVQDGVVTQADIDNGGTTFGGKPLVLGDPRYVDQNNDKKINTDDRVDVGNPLPKYTWGITNTFKYKDFDLNILVQGQNGGYVYGLLGRAINRTGMGYGENTINLDPAVRGNWKTNFGYKPNTDWLYKSDYISVRNITLGYSLNKLLASVSRIDNARVYVSAENWFYWDKYDGGYNPEAVNVSGSSDSRFPVPADYGGTPLSRSLVLGLNINFN
ncbi:TonB-dependent receptor [Wenyingzhuangia sp. chi5]|uniref:TonB-dependent receptor n=1 Tax=Wenyingzhuangia gilva TaxID=3057677 RepID=A0ABT8VMT0_9FLAO|nr:TonB-dependent receptor [Wenyingzhuangia sp. chi5]MDO3693271.1 TonB-dependent receptor [Wenyingzhuangia sp. chi5]